MANNIGNKPVAVQVSGVKKMYRLGQIGGGTLQADLQSWWARVRGKEDPNTKIGEGERIKGQTFMALNGVDLTIYQGEAVGIIGSNGAGKSTLLKLLSKVTAPTEGEIDIYGRIASMLEVGTGFNPEMTGRENVYLNGAILGMTKEEIDAKMEDIIEFSEVREFIDTPVKRYSSGMFVKLAFSVAAHLDSEIMIMDEVLAVGDMAFQKKCLSKMKEAAQRDGRTVLYVSHNMNTIRDLCDRCIVLDKGKVIFEGSVEEAIEVYMGATQKIHAKYEFIGGHNSKKHPKFTLKSVSTISGLEPICDCGDTIKLKLDVFTEKEWKDVAFRFEIQSSGSLPVGTMLSNNAIDIVKGYSSIFVDIDTIHLSSGKYVVGIVAYQFDEYGNEQLIDGVYPAMYFEITEKVNENNPIKWLPKYFGHVHLHDFQIHYDDNNLEKE